MALGRRSGPTPIRNPRWNTFRCPVTSEIAGRVCWQHVLSRVGFMNLCVPTVASLVSTMAQPDLSMACATGKLLEFFNASTPSQERIVNDKIVSKTAALPCRHQKHATCREDALMDSSPRRLFQEAVASGSRSTNPGRKNAGQIRTKCANPMKPDSREHFKALLTEGSISNGTALFFEAGRGPRLLESQP